MSIGLARLALAGSGLAASQTVPCKMAETVDQCETPTCRAPGSLQSDNGSIARGRELCADKAIVGIRSATYVHGQYMIENGRGFCESYNFNLRQELRGISEVIWWCIFRPHSCAAEGHEVAMLCARRTAAKTVRCCKVVRRWCESTSFVGWAPSP